MVVGLGIDLVEVERVRHSLDRFGERFLTRIYHPREMEHIRGNRVQYFAARFAVKEALFKALGTGWAAGVRWVDVEVQNLDSGQPVLHLHGAAREHADRLGVTAAQVSITHTASHAAAVVVLEGSGERRPPA